MSDLIRLLPDSVANQIAAGEVIQRPASAVKELVENAVDSGATQIKIFIKDAGKTLIQIIDNGSGMSPEVVARIFEPYFSTKKERGTGLGLSTVAAIVREFGGAIVVDSEIGRGTTFAVYLPLLEEEGRDATVKRPTPSSLERGNERILIVDDEYPVRNVLSLSLQHLGYTVEVASSGIEALEKYGQAGAFDLVLLDMLMPELSGEETFFKLKEIDPNVSVLVISGYTSERAVTNILDNGGRDFLQKPFTIDELSRKVRECLGRVEERAR